MRIIGNITGKPETYSVRLGETSMKGQLLTEDVQVKLAGIYEWVLTEIAP